MNLQCKKARIPIAALGVTALIAGAGALVSTPAFAAGSLTLTPTTTNVTTVDLAAAAVAGSTSGWNLAQPLSDAAYAAHVSSTGLTTLKLSVDSYTPPTGVTPGTAYLYFAEKATTSATGPTAAAAVSPWTQVTAPTGGGAAVLSSLTLASGASANNVFMAANVPGTYAVHFVDSGTQPGTDDDSVSPTITLTVKDAGAVTAAPSDDWTPAITVPTTVGIGAPVLASVNLSDATLSDARGSSSGAGVLGTQLNKLVGIAFSGPAGLSGSETTSTAGTFGTAATTRSVAVGNTAPAGTLTTNVKFDKNGDGTLTDTLLTTASTAIQSNGVTSVGALAATDIVGSVKTTGTAVAAKPSETSIEYSTTVANTTLATDVADKTVYFTVGSGTPATLAKITTDGTAVDLTGTASKIYSAKTDSTGKAVIKVTTSGAANLDSYTVAAASNSFSAGNSLTTTYATAAATSVKVNSSTTDLTVAAGSAVTVQGAIYDQFGAAVTPASSASQQAQLYVGTVGSTCSTIPAAGQSTTAATQNATVNGGTFSFSFTPATAPTAGQCAAFRIGYDADGGGTITTGESATGQINYASAADAAAISITAPTEAAVVPIQGYASITAGTAVSGTVTDASSATVAYKSVKLTGGDGVYFSTVAAPASGVTSDDLVQELTVVTNGSGVYTAYAFFTDAGSHKITVASGAAATKSVNVTVPAQANTQYYKVSVDDVAGMPGDTLIVSGKVTDMFGNPVGNVAVGLSAGSTTVGSLGATSATTNTDGLFSTTFASGSNSDGEVTLTATLPGGAPPATRVAGATWLANAGLTFDAGVLQSTGKITVKKAELTLTGPAKVTAGGNGAKFDITGTFLPNTSVDVYGKVSGSSVYQLMGSKETDEDGAYTFEVMPMVSTTYLAKSIGLSSGALSVTVYSKVSLTAKAMGGGKVKLSANGDPNVKGPLKFYRSVAGADPRLASMTSSAGGVGTVTVKVGKGSKKFYATFDAPGTNMGTSKIVTIKVK